MKMLRALLVVAAFWVWGPAPAAAAETQKVVERENVAMDDLPTIVRRTLKEEAGGGSVEELTKEYRADKSVTYDAEIVRSGKVSYVQVNSDGKVIGHAKPSGQGTHEKK